MKHLYIIVLLVIIFVSLNTLAVESVHIPDKPKWICENSPDMGNCDTINLWEPRVTAGYWNDNLFCQNFVNKKLLDNSIGGSDDFITASLWLRFLWGDQIHNWFLDCYYNILTNKIENYRTDLLIFLLSFEKELSIGILKVGAGFVQKGNFGGGKLQNGYHSLFNYKQLQIPYLEDRATELLLRFDIERRLLSFNSLNINAYLTDSYTKNIMPKHFELGLLTNYEISQRRSESLWNFEFYFGYVNYYDRNIPIGKLFDSGFTSGMLLSREISKKSKIAVWITKGQYGIGKEPQFGILFSIGRNGDSTPDITDIKFP